MERWSSRKSKSIYQRKRQKYLWFLCPTQYPTNMQWCSLLRTHTPQTEQCQALGGWTDSQLAQNSQRPPPRRAARDPPASPAAAALALALEVGRMTWRVEVSVSHSPTKLPTMLTRRTVPTAEWRQKAIEPWP